MGRTLIIPICLFFSQWVASAATDLRLVDAARQHDLDGVRLLLTRPIDVNTAGADGTTALHWAASAGDFEMTRALLSAGAAPTVKTRIGGLTPLFLAVSAGGEPLISLLLNAGSGANAVNSLTGVTALMKAAAGGNPAAVRLLLEHGADVNAKESGYWQTALMFAASANRAQVIKVLGEYGADLSACSKVTRIAARRDVSDDEFPLDEDLILHANLPPGEQAAKEALAGRRASPTVSGGLTALMLASREGRLEAAQALIATGADINQRSAGDHSPPIVMAIINGHFDLAAFLLKAGADPNLSGDDGLAALYATIDAQWAPTAGGPVPITIHEKVTYLKLMEALLQSKANPNARLARKLWFRPSFHDQMWVGTPGSTAFWRAAQATDLAAMRLLASHGADPRIPSNESDTALMMAAGVGWAGNFSRNAPDTALDAVAYCINLGLDVNARDVTGYTALAGAAWRGDDQVIDVLVARGARLDVRTYRSWSVTDMAAGPYLRTTGGTPHPETVALLLRMGAPPLTPHPDEDILGLVTPVIARTRAR